MRYALLLVMIVVSTGRAADDAVRPPAAATATKAQGPLRDADIHDLQGFWSVGRADLGGKKLNDVLAGEAVTRVVVFLNDTGAPNSVHLTWVARLIESDPTIEPFWTKDKATGGRKKADPSLDRLAPYFAVLLEGKNGRLTGLLFHSNQKDLIVKVVTEKGVGIIKTPRPLPPPILKDRAAAPDLVTALSDPRDERGRLPPDACGPCWRLIPAPLPTTMRRRTGSSARAQLKPGMALDEALKVLLPGLSPAERLKASIGGGWDGRSGSSGYRLDDYWTIWLCLVSFGHERLRPWRLIPVGSVGVPGIGFAARRVHGHVEDVVRQWANGQPVPLSQRTMRRDVYRLLRRRVQGLPAAVHHGRDSRPRNGMAPKRQESLRRPVRPWPAGGNVAVLERPRPSRVQPRIQGGKTGRDSTSW